ncbi:MAG: 7-cyano-7-deazaguanine synthase QueC [Phycisphaerales bacterium]
MPPSSPAVVLLSGGLDSTVALAAARRDGRVCYALTVDYGQRHRVELEAARRVARSLGAVEHRVITLDLRAIGGSALTADIDVPKDREQGPGDRGPRTSEVPVTYVPARNTVFLSLAAGYAEVVGADTIVIGVNAVDYSGYPDCRPEFIAAMERALSLGTKAGAEGDRIRIDAPLARMSKAEIIRLGASLGVDFSLTHSCYDPDSDGAACGRCDSCLIRRRGFEEAGVPDPTRYGVVRPSEPAAPRRRSAGARTP